jgi:hypothetical protein
VCANCSRSAPADAEFCWWCGKKIRKISKDDLEQSRQSPQITTDELFIPDTEFGTLSRYGKSISGIGWFLAVAGPFVFLLLLIIGGKNGALIGLIVGLALVLCGISYVIAGQTISCFVSIEKYNRQTTYLLKALLDKMH